MIVIHWLFRDQINDSENFPPINKSDKKIGVFRLHTLLSYAIPKQNCSIDSNHDFEVQRDHQWNDNHDRD
jgi:hypothetical protein